MVDSKKEYLTIGEISKLCNVSVAALKYYEKSGLLEPAYVDKSTQYRYYSVHQYEKVETIRELRDLDVSVPDICEYMKDRNAKNGLEFFKRHYSNLQNKLLDVQAIMDNMSKQIELLEKYSNVTEFKIRKERFEKREVLYSDLHHCMKINPVEICYAVITVEQLFGKEKNAPTLARGRLGLLIPLEKLLRGHLMMSRLFILVDPEVSDENKKYLKSLHEGEYICLLHRGRYEDRKPHLKKILRYIEENGRTIAGDAVHIQLIDDAISNYPEEYLYDLQVPVV